MTSKILQICQKPATLALLMTILAIIPQQSIQSTSIDEFNIVTGTCTYGYMPLNIYTCTLSNVPILNPTDVLEITGNHLPGHIDADVQAVNHQSSTITFFNGEILRKFVNLRRIQIFEQGLREFGPNAFEFCPHLEELLTALDPQLTSLPPQMMRNCQNLQSFAVVVHSLVTIPEDLFGTTRSLVEFNVGSNQLSSIPANLLQNMANLRRFNVASNLLSQLSSNLLRNAVNLEEFNVASNRFVDQQIIVNILNGHLNLKRLWLNNNNFILFDFRFMAQFQNLIELSVGSSLGQRLTGISWQSLSSSLTTLRIDGIGEEIPGNAFSQLFNLNSLTFNGPGITSLHRDTFSTLSRLEHLTIQNTNIRTLHPELFLSQASLLNLNLYSNQIESLPAGIFTPLINIGAITSMFGIRLVSNNIQKLNMNSFGQHPHLRHIDFLLNRINEIERGIFGRFATTLNYAGFGSNVCISRTIFNGVNLDNDDRLTLCFNNWAGITTSVAATSTTSTTVAPDDIQTTTPNGCGINFRKFEGFVIIFIGFLLSFW
ncbi:hypothetical protein ACKWTF_015885 [Chironomus riparius]